MAKPSGPSQQGGYSQLGPSEPSATGETNSIPAVQGKALDPITTADTSDEGHLRRPSSKDIDGDWNDRDPTSELTEEDKTEESKGVRKRKWKASHGPKTYYIVEKDCFTQNLVQQSMYLFGMGLGKRHSSLFPLCN